MLRLCIIASALWLCSGESLPEDVLEFNDECAEGSCALNALQHRRQPNASEEEHAYGSEEEVIQAFKGKEAVPPGSPKWIECDPLCPEMPAPSDSSDSLGAGPEEDELGSTGLGMQVPIAGTDAMVPVRVPTSVDQGIPAAAGMRAMIHQPVVQ